jgi:hypothetical protein
MELKEGVFSSFVALADGIVAKNFAVDFGGY